MSKATPVKWLWDKRIVLGTVNLMVGEEGIGKGTMFVWLAAQMTNGTLPGDLYGEPCQVLVVGGEDSWQKVWMPRFAAAGADLERCHRVIADKKAGDFSVARATDREWLKQAVESNNVALVFLDQVLDNLGLETNSNDQKQVRNALNPMIAFADDTECSVLMNSHPNKRAGSFRDRVAGSPAMNAISRCSLYVAKHPVEKGHRALVRGKSNYGAPPPGMEFTIGTKIVNGRDGVDISTEYIASWSEDADLTLDDVLAGEQQAKRNPLKDDSKVGRARELLKEILSDGKDHEADAVFAELAKHGIEPHVARRASSGIGVIKLKEDKFKAKSVWRLQAV